MPAVAVAAAASVAPTESLDLAASPPSGPTAAPAASDRFLGLLAHELRNPLAPMRTALELLGRPNVAESTKDRARDILGRQIGQMAGLVEELSVYAGIGSGRVVLQHDVFSLREWIAAALAVARPSLEEKQLLVEPHLPAQALWLAGDRERLAKALGGLLQDAARRSEPGRRVWLRACEGPHGVAVGVRDDGRGDGQDEPPFSLLGEAEPPPGQVPFELFSLRLAVAERLVSAQGGRLRLRRDAATGALEVALVMPIGPAPAG